MKLTLTCIRCGEQFLREKAKENYRIKRGSEGPYCSNSCSSRYDDPRDHKEPDPVPGAKWLRLTRGRFALVDEDMFDGLNRRSWHWTDTGKSAGHAAFDDGKSRVLLHHAVLGVESSTIVDHRDNNGLDCRRENLRIASKQKNCANRGKYIGREGRVFTSSYKGVIDRSRHLTPGASPWLARIRVDGRLIHLGRFDTEIDAAIAYDTAAIQHFGEFAKTNFPLEIKAS